MYLHWVLVLIHISSKYDAEFDKVALLIVQLGSATVSLTTFSLAAKLYFRATDWFLVYILAIRVTITFMLFHWISTGTEGFSLIDPKELNDSIPFLAPLFIGIIVNWKFNIVVCVPVLLISTLFATSYAFTTDNENMTCYKEPE